MSAEQYALVLIPKFAGAISVAFSGLIIYAVSRKIRLNKSTVYDRLIMGMSFSDLLSSFWMSMSSWPIPKSSGVLWAVGNQTTCNLQGFFTHGTVASPIYNASLSFYHLLVVRYKWKNHGLKKYEWCFHFLPIAWSVSTAIAGIPLELYNNANLWCFIASTPDGERGQNASFFRMLFFYGPLYLMILIVTINTVVVVCYVQKITTQAIYHSNSTASSNAQSDDDESSYDESSEEEEEERIISIPNPDGSLETGGTDAEQYYTSRSRRGRKSQTSTSTARTARLSRQVEIRDNRYAKWRRRVALQNLRYAVAFYWTWVPISAVRMLQILNIQVPFWLIVVASSTCPMQGLANVLVYFYPAFMKLQKTSKETGSPLNLWKWINAGMQAPDVGNSEGQHHQVGAQEEIAKQKAATLCTIEHGTADKATTPPATEEQERTLHSSPATRLKKHEANVSRESALKRPSSERRFHGHNVFHHGMSSITISGVLTEAIEMLESQAEEGSDQYPKAPPLFRPNRGLPSTSSITLSELEPIEEKRVPSTAPVTLGGLEREKVDVAHSGLPSTPMRYPSEASGTEHVDGGSWQADSYKAKEDGRPIFGRKVSFKEDQSAENKSQQSVDQSPKLPDRNASKTKIDNVTANETSIPLTGILKTRNPQAALDCIPDQPRRIVSHDTPHISDDDSNANGGRRFFGILPSRASIKRQTSNATSDSTPTPPERPVSGVDVSFEENINSEKNTPVRRFPKPLSSAKQRQLSIDSDCAPKLPLRPESNVSLVEGEGGDNVHQDPASLLHKPSLKSVDLQPSNKETDSTSRPAYSASQVEESEDHVRSFKKFPKPLDSMKRRQTSFDSDCAPVLPRRPPSDFSHVEEHDEDFNGGTYSDASFRSPLVVDRSANSHTTPTFVGKNDSNPIFPERPISSASDVMTERDENW
mmetsp:Transcript_33145/g.51393  ORF Transcript_33145/g.51393 Transcript_33145/m.51393 type:complete len:929 (-) Transcript_33145:105-2891(-)|eukprot:CAMPEP_0117004596 /NCGR_PEP_ID=MMETSP0472-20121206/5507_1 /TAXON_ID=693140 ORGANISM="Tiarina fusus, Strain LIS" /NCGR_SAMPLE_ID=MMETSP0472 /ASSEMBLY_ACC=CAM_ASM_000603 /LENGTH=928 /DNA_ID=CAMNT_0004705585 /DNA_START=133 /DNA_END=2919 /DNA_ORIENTATION=-